MFGIEAQQPQHELDDLRDEMLELIAHFDNLDNKNIEIIKLKIQELTGGFVFKLDASQSVTDRHSWDLRSEVFNTLSDEGKIGALRNSLQTLQLLGIVEHVEKINIYENTCQFILEKINFYKLVKDGRLVKLFKIKFELAEQESIQERNYIYDSMNTGTKYKRSFLPATVAIGEKTVDAGDITALMQALQINQEKTIPEMPASMEEITDGMMGLSVQVKNTSDKEMEKLYEGIEKIKLLDGPLKQGESFKLFPKLKRFCGLFNKTLTDVEASTELKILYEKFALGIVNLKKTVTQPDPRSDKKDMQFFPEVEDKSDLDTTFAQKQKVRLTVYGMNLGERFFSTEAELNEQFDSSSKISCLLKKTEIFRKAIASSPFYMCSTEYDATKHQLQKLAKAMQVRKMLIFRGSNTELSRIVVAVIVDGRVSQNLIPVKFLEVEGGFQVKLYDQYPTLAALIRGEKQLEEIASKLPPLYSAHVGSTPAGECIFRHYSINSIKWTPTIFQISGEKLPELVKEGNDGPSVTRGQKKKRQKTSQDDIIKQIEEKLEQTGLGEQRVLLGESYDTSGHYTINFSSDKNSDILQFAERLAAAGLKVTLEPGLLFGGAMPIPYLKVYNSAAELLDGLNRMFAENSFSLSSN